MDGRRDRVSGHAVDQGRGGCLWVWSALGYSRPGTLGRASLGLAFNTYLQTVSSLCCKELSLPPTYQRLVFLFKFELTSFDLFSFSLVCTSAAKCQKAWF